MKPIDVTVKLGLHSALEPLIGSCATMPILKRSVSEA